MHRGRGDPLVQLTGIAAIGVTVFGASLLVRVPPSDAKRFFIHIQHRGERVWQIVGDADAMNPAEARR